MKTSASKPTITQKWHIEVPTHQYESVATLYKVWFGKYYLIWKGKSLLQSAQYLAEGIERYLRLQKNIETDYLYHVCNYLRKSKLQTATIEVLEQDFTRTVKGVESVNGYALLVAEQKALDKASGDPLCLNNNEFAYVSAWITKAHQVKFSKYLRERKKPVKK
jgi:hypothetical protein